MNVNHHQTKRERSYFEWGDKMQIIRKGKGDIAMTESELVDFFGVTWKKLNYRLQQLLKVSSLRPDERDTGELEVFVNGLLKGMPHFIRFQSSSLYLINWTARKYTCSGNTSVENCNALYL